MTGRIQGINTRIAAAVEEAVPGAPFYRMWCGAHQLDLVVKRAVVQDYLEESFYKKLTGLIGWLRRQQSFILETGSKYPKVADTRWLTIGRVLQWISSHKDEVIALLDLKEPDVKPPQAWWLAFLPLHMLMKDVDILFQRLQAADLLVSTQKTLLNNFVAQVVRIGNLEGPLDEESLESLDEESYHKLESFAMKKDSVENYILASHFEAANGFALLPAESKVAVKESVAKLLLTFVVGVDKIDPHLDATDKYPPCFPLDFASMGRHDMMALVQKHLPRLQVSFARRDIEALQDEHNQLEEKFNSNVAFKDALVTEKATMSFEKAWNAHEKTYPSLHQVAGGLASVFPGTSRVEGDFSIINWEKNPNRKKLMDLSLEGVLHSKQMEVLRKM
jgi:hypothetical protein